MANANIKAVITAEDRSAAALRGFSKNVEGVGSKIATIARRAGAALAVATTGAAIFGVKTAASLESSRQGFVTLLGSAEAADKTMARIKKEAARTPFEITGLTQATQMLAGMTKNGDRALDFVLDIGEGLAAMGRGQAELDRISVNLQQIAATGRAFGIDIRQFAFAGIPIYEMLQKETGLAGEALQDFIETGGVTFEMLEKMFDRANDKGGQFFEAYKNQSGTLNQLWSNLKDTFAVTMSDILVKSGIFDQVKDKVKDLSKWITDNRETIVYYIKQGVDLLKAAFEELSPFIQIAWDLLKNITGFIKDNTWVISALAGAFIAVKTAMFIGDAVLAFSGFMAAIRGQAVLTAGAGGIGGLTGALQFFRALALSPIVLPALAIGAVLVSIAVMYKTYVDAKNAIEGMSNSIRSRINSDTEVAQRLLRLVDTGTAQQKAAALKSAQGLGLNLSSQAGLAHFAGGTNYAPGGMALVGEEGPELVHLPKGSKVIPNHQMGEGGTVNITVQAGAFMGSQQDARKYAKMIMDAYKDLMAGSGVMA